MSIPTKSTAPPADSELLARFARTRDDAAFAEIVRRHLPLVLATTRRRLGDSGLADDAAQQVFIRLSAKARQVRKHPSLVAWLHRSAVFEASNLARRESRHRRRARQWEPPPAPGNAPPELDLALARLGERDRQILVLHYVEGETYAAIARRLGISEAAAQRRGHRALERLERELGTSGRSSCTTALVAAFTAPQHAAPPELLARLSTLKHTTALGLAWLPAAAVLTIGTGTWAALSTRDAEPPAPSPPPPALATTARPKSGPRFEPQTADEDLSPAIREFVALGRSDTAQAWAFAREQPGELSRFLDPAVRALADRDLPAAERLLDIVKGLEPREAIVRGILGSRAAGDFESAIAWLDSLPDPKDRTIWKWNLTLSYGNNEHEDWDYAGALGSARTPEVREFLIHEVCAKASRLNEPAIEALAAQLDGEERQLALAHAAVLHLRRGDPRGYALLASAGEAATRVDGISEIALRDPAGLLDWIVAQTDEVDRRELLRSVWYEWGKNDAAAAADWALAFGDRRKRFDWWLTPMDDTLKRLMQQP